ncbi:MAG: hypothetical protein V5A72_03375 [Candidatus Nanohaloarchaea archaeon]
MTKYVYTLSSRGIMFEHAFLSIKTLSRYVDVSEIVVFFTPPIEDIHVEKLKSLGVDVKIKNNCTDEFVAFDEPQHYGEKTWITEIEDSQVVFLDCDTFVLGDIRKALKGNFEFKAREDEKVHQPEWSKMFERFDEPYIDWMPNAGFLIFKNNIHKKIGDTWRRYIQKDLGYSHDFNHKEQYALALAVGEANCVMMDSSEHAMFWKDEFPSDGMVYHSGKELEKSSKTDLEQKSGFLRNLRKLYNFQ